MCFEPFQQRIVAVVGLIWMWACNILFVGPWLNKQCGDSSMCPKEFVDGPWELGQALEAISVCKVWFLWSGMKWFWFVGLFDTNQRIWYDDPSVCRDCAVAASRNEVWFVGTIWWAWGGTGFRTSKTGQADHLLKYWDFHDNKYLRWWLRDFSLRRGAMYCLVRPEVYFGATLAKLHQPASQLSSLRAKDVPLWHLKVSPHPYEAEIFKSWKQFSWKNLKKSKKFEISSSGFVSLRSRGQVDRSVSILSWNKCVLLTGQVRLALGFETGSLEICAYKMK